MFKAIGRFFRGIGKWLGKFFKNLIKDPLKTILTIIATVLAVFTFQLEFLPAIWAGYAAATTITAGVMAWGAAIAITVIGINNPWLSAALVIFNLTMSVFSFFGGTDATSFLSGFSDNPAWTKLIIYYNTPTVALIRLGASAFFAYADIISIRDGVLLSEGAVLASVEIGETIGGVAGGVVSGALSGLFDSGLGGMLLLGVAAFIGYKMLTKEEGPSFSFGGSSPSTT